jgi:hypothetical protein
MQEKEPIFELEAKTEDYSADTKKKKNSNIHSILLTLFIFLFICTSLLFVYYQFFIGRIEDKAVWDFTLRKRTNNILTLYEALRKNSALRKQVDSLETICKSFPDTSLYALPVSSGLFDSEIKGVQYQVQIGAFKEYDFSRYNKHLVNMNTDIVNGMTTLLIGRFETFGEACKFRSDLIAMGVKDAFIIKTVDGKRVPFDEYCP